MISPPRDLDELRLRAEALAGRTIEAIARELAIEIPVVGVRTKGKIGALVERALGASAGSQALPDFPHLGVELKTIPVDAALRPRESTYVCRIDLGEADRIEWRDSWVRAKLAHVLWVPIVEWHTVGAPVFWRPSAEEEAILRADFEELMGTIGAGRIEDLTARDGVALQVRPKARDGRVRTIVYDRDGEPIATVPRGFYLRARFTGAVIGAR